MSEKRLHELIDAYADQTLTPADRVELEQRLISSRKDCREFWDHMEFHAQVRELMLQADGEQALLPSPKAVSGQAPFRLSRLLPLAAAAIVMLVAGWWWMGGSRTGVAVARVVGVQGHVVINQSHSLGVGDSIPTETTVETGNDGEVKLIYGEEVADVVLGKNSKLLIAGSKSEKTLRLEKGQLAATVSRQTENKPFTLMTPQAEMRVVGTKFSVFTGQDSTRLEVAEGEVRLQSAHGLAAMVRGGFEATVAPGVSINPGLIGRSPKLPANVVFFRDFEAIYPGETTYNELVRWKESGVEVTALESIPSGEKTRTKTFLPDVELSLARESSGKNKTKALFVVPLDMEIRIRVRAEQAGKMGISSIPTHLRFNQESFYAENFDVGPEWKEVVVRSRDMESYMAEGASRDFVPGVGIWGFNIYGFGTGKIHVDSFAVTSGSAP